MEQLEHLIDSVLIAHEDGDIRRDIRASLPTGIGVQAECESCAALRAMYPEANGGLVISGVAFADGDGLEALVAASREHPRPAVIVTDRPSLAVVERAMRDHVMAYLLLPVDPGELHAAMVVAKHRHDELMELREEVSDLREALEHRKVIERAKGMIMGSRGLSERDAYAWLRTTAQSRRARILEVAREIADGVVKQPD